MNDPKDRMPDCSSPLTLSLLISETVYKLVVLVERSIRLFSKYILRPCVLQFRCLLW